MEEKSARIIPRATSRGKDAVHHSEQSSLNRMAMLDSAQTSGSMTMCLGISGRIGSRTFGAVRVPSSFDQPYAGGDRSPAVRDAVGCTASEDL